MANAMMEIGAITKDRINQQQGFKFRGIDDVYNELHDILARHRIFTIPEVLEDRTEERTTRNGSALIYRILTIKYTFFADDGSNVSCIVIGEGMDSGDKASNKAMSIAHKYALFQTFLIPTEEEKDPDAEAHEVLPKPAQKESIKKDETIKESIKDETDYRGEIIRMLEEMWGGDKNSMGQALKAVTGFQGKKGWVEGTDDVFALKDRRNEKGASQLTIAYGKVKKEYEEWLKRGE